MPDDKLLALLPDTFQEIKETASIMDVEEVQVDRLRHAIDRYLDDQFVETASIEAIRQRETELGIQANPSQETLEFRRKRIINRYSTKVPFTERHLQNKLDFLFGPDRGKVQVDVQNFILRIYANLADATLFQEAQATIEQIKPANLEYLAVPWVSELLNITDRVTVNLRRYNTFSEFSLGMSFMKYESEVELP